MHHRGPDNASIWSAPGIGLVHTRLSLVDLTSSSDQPFWDPTGRYVLVFNGEIYNFRELRAELADAAQFQTTGDTEVLMAMLVHRGLAETVQRLEGMFAFAFHDTRSGTTVLARDRFGIKPVVYHQSADRFLFASEVRSLRPWMRLHPDPFSVSAFLSGFQGPASGYSMFQGVRVLPPGHCLTISPGSQPVLEEFASIADLWNHSERERLSRTPPAKLVDELESLLGNSVRSQLLADAPVGVFCSGGVDSSVVVSMAAATHSNLAIFHADVVGRHSERRAAEDLARHLGLELRVIPVQDRDFLDLLPAVIAHYERPVTIRPDSIPFLNVCRLVQDHNVKGVLSGEAADECFLGYQSMMPGLDALRKWIPRPSFGAARNFYRRVALGKHAEFEPQAERADLSQAIASRFEVEMVKSRHARLRDISGSPISKNDLKTLDALGYHLRTLLHRNDTLGMSASIESRFPFLDSKVVRFAVNLPHEYKIRRSLLPGDLRHPFFTDKWILRQVARRHVPEHLSRRPKRAFPTNAFRRMRIAPGFFVKSQVADLLEWGPEEREFFSSAARPVLQQRLMQLEVWMRVAICGVTQESVSQHLHNHVTIEPDRS